LVFEGVSAIVLVQKNTVDKPLLITLNYQQRVIYSGSETASVGSLEPLQMTFSIVVHCCWSLWTGKEQ
jgi:hypothetical protein